MNCSHLSRHERSQQHKQAVEALGKVQVADLEPVPFSGGVAGGVPRLDRWLHAAQVLERSGSFAGLSNLVSIASVGSGMMHGHGSQDDSGPRMCKRLISCMAEPLRWRDLQVLGNSTCASIGIDERDGVLLLYARVYVRKTQEVGDTFLGLVRDQGTLPSDCRRGIELVIMQACTVKTGKGLEEVCNVCNDAVETFKKAVRSAVADGPTEQRALFDCSPALSKNPLFPNLTEIERISGALSKKVCGKELTQNCFTFSRNSWTSLRCCRPRPSTRKCSRIGRRCCRILPGVSSSGVSSAA